MTLRSSNQFHIVGLILAVAALSPVAVPAATYVFISDGTLFDQATLVAEGTIAGVAATPTRLDLPATEYRMTVQEVLKGEHAFSQVVFALPGGTSSDGRTLHVPGVPTFREGEEVLLFLTDAEDGTLDLLHWALGAFRKLETEGRVFALRDIREEDFLGRSATGGGTRDHAAFADWLRDRAAGIERRADYFATDGDSAIRGFYNLFRSNGRNSRWPDFDAGGEVIYKTGPGNNFGSPGLLQPALDAWNRVRNTNLRLRRVGATGATGGLTRSDGVNTLVYGDPNRLMPGKFKCASGGVLGAGFFWTSGVANAFGKTFNRIVEGDIVINDGVECLKGLTQIIAEFFTHEVGHTLGIAHSCGSPATGPCTNRGEDDATMRATVHADGRGASLRADDTAAALALYRGSGGGGTPPPGPAPNAVLLPPSDLNADTVTNKKVTLSWVDHSTGETENEVWLKKGKKKWELGTTAGADATGATIKQLEAGTQYKFRVRSKAGQNVSKYSDNVKIKTSGGGGAPAAPSELAVVATSNTTATLSWKDNSNNEKKFVIQIMVGDGPWGFLQNADANTTSVAFEGATPGESYGFRIRARRGDQFSEYSNEATITMPE